MEKTAQTAETPVSARTGPLTCFACKHFAAHTADPGYSEWTPGSDFSIECYKGHWNFNAYKEDERSLYTKLTKATDCPDFTAR